MTQVEHVCPCKEPSCHGLTDRQQRFIVMLMNELKRLARAVGSTNDALYDIKDTVAMMEVLLPEYTPYRTLTKRRKASD